uniref:MATA-HMG n=2 Tax=Rhizophagus irregularis TaxID=588596 RepID=A0A1B1EW59_9GLOM|nr:MATA-HMG [Rhizophagus irregularis]
MNLIMEPEIDRKREHIFLDSSDPSMPNQVFLDDPISPSIVKLPFPPHIDPYKLITDRKQDGGMSRIPARTPNAFILYRKIFIESARKEGYHLPMTVISSMASKSWKHEPDNVKEEYKKISKQAFEIRKQLIPKTSRKKKREKWNFVSFSNKSNLNDSSNKIEMKTFVDNQSKDIQQQKDLSENMDSFKPNLETVNPLPYADSLPNNVNEENGSYTKEQLNYQIDNQKPINSINYTNWAHNSYNNNKDIGFESLSHGNNVTNVYDINQYQLYNDDGTNSHSADNSLHYNFQPYYNNMYNM